MNILVIGKFYTEGFALHISETLSEMGHSVKRFEPGYKLCRLAGTAGHRFDQVRGFIHNSTDSLPIIRARRMRKLWEIAEQESYDIAIVCHDFLWPDEVSELKRRTGALVVLWFPDALVNFGKAYFMNAPYDALFFKDPYIVRILGNVLTTPVYYLPECFNPARHVLPNSETSKSDTYACDLTIVGNPHSYRVAFFKHLKDYDVKYWGNPAPLWLPTGPVRHMHQGRGVYNEDKARAFRSAKIVINNLHYGEIWGVNVRTFEVAGIGAFQMVDWRPGLSQLFEDGKELISFKGIHDLKQKIDYWLPRYAERIKIAEAGKRKAYAEHTYRHRLDVLFETLFGNDRGFSLPKVSEIYGFDCE